MRDPAAIYVLGVDAGATHSRALLSAPDCGDLGIEEGPPFNLRSRDPLYLRDFVDDAMQRLIPRERRLEMVVRAIAVGAAGIGTAEERNLVRDVLQNKFSECHVYVHHDAYIAHYGAFAGDPGVIVSSGTGSIAYGRNGANREARAGGWGWMLGDEGGGWWIAREAVRASLAAWEGSGSETRITGLLTSRFSVDDAYALVPRIYGNKISREEFIALGESLAELARDGDAVARDLYHRAGIELGKLALRCAVRLELPPGEFRVALLGGVAAGAGDLLKPGVNAAWEAGGGANAGVIPRLVDPDSDALHGAVSWARDILLKRSFA